MCWFDTIIYSNMITIIELANTYSMSHTYYFCFVVRKKVQFLSNFYIYNPFYEIMILFIFDYNHHAVDQISRTCLSTSWKFDP